MSNITNPRGLEHQPLARVLASIVPILAIAAPGVVIAGGITNSASVSIPAGTIDANAANNTVEDSDDLFVEIIAADDLLRGVNGRSGQSQALNVLANDRIDGANANPGNVSLALAPGSSLPAGISFDPGTGNVGVEPDTAEGDYTFEYQVCDIAVPDNCQTASVTIGVVVPASDLSGTVYRDLDGDREIDPGDNRLGGWIVEIWDGDQLIASTTTDANGDYRFDGLPGGTEYTIRFRHPDTGVVYEEIGNVQLDVAASLPDQNLPIDPSGVIYDSVTRAPVAGATALLVDASGNPLPTACYLDPSQENQVTSANGEYRFDIVPGAAAACPQGETEYTIRVIPPAGYSFTSTILPPQAGSLDPTGRGNPYMVSTSPIAPSGADPVYYLSFALASGDPDVVNNHIALDPFLTRDLLVVTKVSPKRTASVGDLVPYEITVRNPEPYRRADVDVIDVLPAGFTYVEGSARVAGAPAEPEATNGNRELVWRDQVIPANGSVTYSLTLVVGAGVTQGQSVNTGMAENGADGGTISNRGTATVAIVPSTVFDCSELIGQVFEDRDGDGYQDDGEKGIPAVRLATVNGQLITTDEYGRYHIACAAVPDARMGSNFVLKLDESTLPQGWVMTTDNPRSVRLTRGKMGELNFGVGQAELVELVFDERAFRADGSLSDEVKARLRALAERDPARLVLRARYDIRGSATQDTIARRTATIRTFLKTIFEEGWDGPTPVIQVNAVQNVESEGEEQ